MIHTNKTPIKQYSTICTRQFSLLISAIIPKIESIKTMHALISNVVKTRPAKTGRIKAKGLIW